MSLIYKLLDRTNVNSSQSSSECSSPKLGNRSFACDLTGIKSFSMRILLLKGKYTCFIKSDFIYVNVIAFSGPLILQFYVFSTVFPMNSSQDFNNSVKLQLLLLHKAAIFCAWCM